MRARVEPFGAWVRLDDATLVAVTRKGAEKLGLRGGALWEEGREDLGRPPLEVHLAVTARCPASCAGCYLDAKPEGASPSFEALEARLADLAAQGVFTVAFGGGEPLVRADLGRLARRARELGLTPVMTTSGLGLTRERARELAPLAQVNVSYDGPSEGYSLVRGWDGAGAAERAMAALRAEGIPFGVNTVLTRATFPRLRRTAERVVDLGAREMQLLRYKPAGRAARDDYLEKRLSPEQVSELGPTLRGLLEALPLAVRIDCAMVPLLSACELDPALLGRLGVFGCEAGRHLAAVRVDGLVAPCSFAPPSAQRSAEAFREGSRPDLVLTAWSAPHDLEPCSSCSLRAVCRGGCRVVAAHLEGALGPDPECPRVAAHRAREASLARPG